MLNWNSYGSVIVKDAFHMLLPWVVVSSIVNVNWQEQLKTAQYLKHIRDPFDYLNGKTTFPD